MSNLLVQFKNHLQQQFPQIAVQNNILVLAISGGVDSVVLLHLLSASGYKLELAHCNFQIRAEESERDEVFVQSLAIQYQKKLHLRRFNTAQIAASEKKINSGNCSHYSLQLVFRTDKRKQGRISCNCTSCKRQY